MTRGDLYTAPSGAVGRFVGEHNGLLWVAYPGDDFAAACARFDLWASMTRSER